MEYKAINKENQSSSLIKIETLQKEYEVTLQQYQEAVKNYIGYLQAVDINNSTGTYESLVGRTWWGSGKSVEGNVQTQEECEAMCANAGNCSGATFNKVKRYCWTRTGDGNITPGEDSDYALLPKQKAALIVMKSLNEKLLTINENIINEMKQITPEMEKQKDERVETYKKLDKSYQDLLEQKVELEEQLRDYHSINEEYTSKTLYLNQSAQSMKFWGLGCALILLVTFSYMYGSSFPFWVIIAFIMVGLSFIISAPYIFIVWFLFFLVFFMMWF